MRKRLALALIMAALMIAALAGCSSGGGLPQMQKPKSGDEVAIMKTNMGELKIMFFPDAAPKAVQNFKELAKSGYYNDITFHRVVNDFMIQSGDPNGDSTGGESIWGEPFEDEFAPDLHNFRGALSMANSGQNTNGSQFFIVQAPTCDEYIITQFAELAASEEYKDVALPDNRTGKDIPIKDVFSTEVMDAYRSVGGAITLDYVHTVFGQVYEGLEVVDAIAGVECDLTDPNAPKPLEPIYIESIEIVKY